MFEWQTGAHTALELCKSGRDTVWTDARWVAGLLRSVRNQLRKSHVCLCLVLKTNIHRIVSVLKYLSKNWSFSHFVDVAFVAEGASQCLFPCCRYVVAVLVGDAGDSHGYFTQMQSRGVIEE